MPWKSRALPFLVCLLLGLVLGRAFAWLAGRAEPPPPAAVPAQQEDFAALLASAEERLVADTSLREYSETPGRTGAVSAFQHLIERAPKNARAHLGLGRAHLWNGEWDAAETALRRALELAAADPGLRRAARAELARVELAEAAKMVMHPGYHALRVQPLRSPAGEALWAVLGGLPGLPNERDGRPNWYDALDLWILQRQGERLRIAEQVGPLLNPRVWDRRAPVPHPDPTADEGARHPHSPSSLISLQSRDLTGDGLQEVVVTYGPGGASWLPTHLQVYAWREGRLKAVLEMPGTFPPWIADLDGDGRYELVRNFSFGWRPPNAGRRRWEEVYAWREGRYTLVSHEFLDRYADLVEYLEDALFVEHAERIANRGTCYCDDPELWHHLAIYYDWAERRPEARSAYEQAERFYLAALEADRFGGTRGAAAEPLREVRRRLWELQGIRR